MDILSNKYADNLVEYAPRPTCKTSSDECKSEFLWCDTLGIWVCVRVYTSKSLAVEAHCVSKIKLHGNCTGFEWSKEACYEGQCISGKCRNREDASTEPTEFNTKSMEKLKQKTLSFFRQKSHRPLSFQVVNVKELSKTEKVSRVM